MPSQFYNKFFEDDKVNFIGYVFMLFIIGGYLSYLKNININTANFVICLLYIFMIGFIYNGIQFLNCNELYIEEYYKRNNNTFKYLYCDYTLYPRDFLEIYYPLKTSLLFIPFMFYFFIY